MKYYLQELEEHEADYNPDIPLIWVAKNDMQYRQRPSPSSYNIQMAHILLDLIPGSNIELMSEDDVFGKSYRRTMSLDSGLKDFVFISAIDPDPIPESAREFYLTDQFFTDLITQSATRFVALSKSIEKSSSAQNHLSKYHYRYAQAAAWMKKILEEFLNLSEAGETQ